MSRRERTTTDTFLEAVCLFRNLVYIFFVLSLVFFLISLVSYFVLEPGTETHAIVVLNMIGLGVFILISGGVLVLCRDDDSSR